MFSTAPSPCLAARFLSNQASFSAFTAARSSVARQARLKAATPSHATTSPLHTITSRTISRRSNKLSTPISRKYATTTAPASAAADSSKPLTWNRFLELRKTRRRMFLASSIVSSGIVLSLGMSSILASGFEDKAAAQVGLDPIIVLGLSGLTLGAAGWLLGPTFGNQVFKLMYKRYRNGMVVKERDLFHRIAKHRSDPSKSTMSNPIPDYYGEKIGSVRDYRRWLRDQRAHRLKSSTGGTAPP